MFFIQNFRDCDTVRRGNTIKQIYQTLDDLNIFLHCKLKLEVVMELWISNIFHLVSNYFDC